MLSRNTYTTNSQRWATNATKSCCRFQHIIRRRSTS